MASVQYLFSLSGSLQEELVDQQKLFNILQKLRNICALIIQKTWRGYDVYKKYKRIKNAIIVIQKYNRGFMVRKRKQQYVQEYEERLAKRHLDRMATIIQAVWRGYIVRKYIKVLPKALVAERKRIQLANEEMQRFVKEQFQKNRDNEKSNEEEESKKMVLFILFKCHHLLRTYMREGVYSLHETKMLSTIEMLMSALPFKEYMKQVRKVYNDTVQVLHKTSVYLFKDKKLRKIEDLLRMRDKSHDVRSVHQFDKNIHDKPFNLSCKIDKYYERELLRTGKYTKQIMNVGRSEDKTKNIIDKDFILYNNLDRSDHFNIPYYIDFWETQKCSLHNPVDLGL